MENPAQFCVENNTFFLKLEKSPIELFGDSYSTRTVAGVIPFILSPAVVEKREDGNERSVGLKFIC